MPDLEIVLASIEDRLLLANLLQFYMHDFSEYWAGELVGELEDDGRFEDYPLDGYWREPDRIPLLFRLHGRPAGFALLNATGHRGEPVDRNMAEFFVVRKHRGAGVGLAAAQSIFSRYPGRWEVAVARRNPRALPFWRRTISSHLQVCDLIETDLDDQAWNGQVMSFAVSGS